MKTCKKIYGAYFLPHFSQNKLKGHLKTDLDH